MEEKGNEGKTRLCRITTIDNPFDPFDQFDDWYAFDAQSGWHTPEYLARVCHTSHYLSDEDQRIDQEIAIDEIIRLDLFKVYKKVVRYV